MVTQDKVRATILGAVIGDSLGKAVEMKSAQYIKENYGRVDKYLDCSGHKYFDGDKLGTWTDDAQLTLCIARSIINTGNFNIEDIVAEHVKEYKTSVKGWGGSTREAVGKIANGMEWHKASITDNPKLGVGNGIAMKVSPVAIYMAMKNISIEEITKNIAELSLMTHRTSMAITSGLAQTFAIFQCLSVSENSKFQDNFFLTNIAAAGMIGRTYLSETLTEDDIANRFDSLKNYKDFSTEDIIDKFGAGSCYVYDSLPFTYTFFLKNPESIDSLYDCCSSGGDTDTNSSMLGALLGSLHGMKIFPKHLIDGLDQKDMILDIADQLYEKLK